MYIYIYIFHSGDRVLSSVCVSCKMRCACEVACESFHLVPRVYKICVSSPALLPYGRRAPCSVTIRPRSILIPVPIPSPFHPRPRPIPVPLPI